MLTAGPAEGKGTQSKGFDGCPEGRGQLRLFLVLAVNFPLPLKPLDFDKTSDIFQIAVWPRGQRRKRPLMQDSECCYKWEADTIVVNGSLQAEEPQAGSVAWLASRLPPHCSVSTAIRKNEYIESTWPVPGRRTGKQHHNVWSMLGVGIFSHE